MNRTTSKLADCWASIVGVLEVCVFKHLGGTGKHLKIGRLTFVLPKKSRLHIFSQQQ